MWKKVFHRVKAPEGGGMTKWLFFSISVCVFGNSFLYGYNIGVVNSPALIIKTFYSQVYLARDGIETVFNPQDKGLHYVDPARYVNTTTPAVVVVDNNSNTTADNSTALSDNSTKGTYAVETTTVRPVSMAKTETEINEDNFIELLWSLTVALFVFFGMVGAFASGRVADYFGRKKGMIIITVLMFFAAMFGGITTIAKSPECLMISRIFVGLHNGVSVSLASLYLAEISPRSIRGAVGTCHQLFITVGILWSQVLGLPDISGGWGVWPWLFAFNALPALACLVLFPLCPESPRYLLIKKADEDGAKKALVKLRGYDNVEEEMEEMRVEARRASSVEQFTLKKLLTTPELKLPIIIACTLQVAQQWSGINAAMSYSTFIFKQATIPENTIPYVIVGQGAVNVLATIVCVSCRACSSSSPHSLQLTKPMPCDSSRPYHAAKTSSPNPYPELHQAPILQLVQTLSCRSPSPISYNSPQHLSCNSSNLYNAVHPALFHTAQRVPILQLAQSLSYSSPSQPNTNPAAGPTLTLLFTKPPILQLAQALSCSSPSPYNTIHPNIFPSATPNFTLLFTKSRFMQFAQPVSYSSLRPIPYS